MQLAFHFIVSQSNNLLLFLSYFSFNEGYIKFGATAENLIGVSPTREAIIRLYVIERTNIVLLKWFQRELTESDL